MNDAYFDYDLVIVGGGLVGASLACALGDSGLRIAVIEAAPFVDDAKTYQPSFDARTVALAQGSQQIFSSMGLWDEIEKLGVEVCYNIEEIIPRIDVLNVLRIQLERQDSGYFPTLREYHNYFGITRERLEKAGKPITIMHPGPINRGVELDSDIADSSYSIILDQVTNGVAVRMAVLYLLSGVESSLKV